MRKLTAEPMLDKELKLEFSLTFEDLYTTKGLNKVDHAWLQFLSESDAGLYQQLMHARTNPSTYSKKESSDLIISLSWLVERFIGRLFGITEEVQTLAQTHTNLHPLYKCKRLFVQRDAARKFSKDQTYNIDQVKSQLAAEEINPGDELSFASRVCEWMDKGDEEKLNIARAYTWWALFEEEGKKAHKEGVLFKIPLKTDNLNLLPDLNKNFSTFSATHTVIREGFKHTDHLSSLPQALDQANYCIHCHHQSKDSCSHGFKDPKGGSYKINELGVTLAGCPLEEKISEMNQLKSEGSVLGALATATIDNPMVAGTGHRICNDCMKSCIYQKQEPVNIPMVETKVLNDVLELPWGFEIYSLFTRWNPLKFADYLPKDKTNHKVLVVGLGPAGYTLSHYLLNQGLTVVAVDGLKIEPLEPVISGIDELGTRYKFKPVYNIKTELYEPLDTRKAYGFGGVAEYGITVRWNKNYLKVIRLLLERRENFRMYGGVRYGSNISVDDAWSLGFDHVALCMGAGKPNLLNIPNTFAKGVRTASDFLMTLQLSGAAREASIANLHLRLPVVVIGGGLTAIDTATESLAYYPVQVEKFLKHFEKVGESFLDKLTVEERVIAEEFISHAKELRATSKEQRLELIKKWGGVKVAYRKKLQDSPAYRLNHEEVGKALEEGIEFIEDVTPLEIIVDGFGSVKKVLHNNGSIDAHSVLIATGTNPNTSLASEEPEHFVLDGSYFKLLNIEGTHVQPERISKPQTPHVITYKDERLRAISFFGDQHPSFSGNVVKAMGSAKYGAPIISTLLATKKPETTLSASEFFSSLDNKLTAFVEEVRQLTSNIVEVIVRSPLASFNFQPGQFYRLQNFEDHSLTASSTVMAMEGLALTGAWVDKEKGLISLIALEMGGSSDLCRYLQVGERVVLMGPTGEPTEIKANETVMLVGGGLGNAVLFSIGKAFKEKSSKVIYFAGYKKPEDRYKMEEIEAASNLTVWCCDNAELTKNRSMDFTFKGNIVEAIAYYGSLNGTTLKLQDVDRIIAIGSDNMMAAVSYARHNQLKHLFKNSHVAIASINSPMQCMMKEICGQCIQRHVDPITQKEAYVFSCMNQDQDMDKVDFNHLKIRLQQNSLQEKLCKEWIKINLIKAA